MISRETLKARYIRHLQTGQFDLSIKFPENDENSSRYDLFDWPYMVFVPETEFYKIKTANKLLLRPQCINRDCHCTPVFFKHCYRLITTLSGVVALIYAHWTCADSGRSRNTSSAEAREGSTVELSSTDMGLVGSPTSFSTLSEEYMDKLPLNMRQQLEFVFSKKGGVHIDFMTAVLHPAMLTVGPALGTAEHTKTMTAKYYKTLRKASGWRHQPVALDESLASTVMPLYEYLERNALPGRQELTNLWLKWTEPYKLMAQALMKNAAANRFIAVTQIPQFAKKISLSSNNRLRILYFAINDIGQILHFKFVDSDNRQEAFCFLNEVMAKHMTGGSRTTTEASNAPDGRPQVAEPESYDEESLTTSHNLSTESNEVSWLERDEEFNIAALSLKQLYFFGTPSFPPLDRTQDLMVLCDDANSMLLGSGYSNPRCRILQDSRNIIQRIISKIVPKEREEITNMLVTMFDNPNNYILPREVLFNTVRAFLTRIPIEMVTVPQTTWEGSILNTLNQIWRGDCSYSVSGPVTEIHGVVDEIEKALTRNVGVAVGARILDILISEINLRQGAKFNRNPSFDGILIPEFMKTVLDAEAAGFATNSPEIEFAISLLKQYSPNNPDQVLENSTVDTLPDWRKVFGVSQVMSPIVQPSEAVSESQQNRLKLINPGVLAERMNIVFINSEAEFNESETMLLHQLIAELLEIEANLVITPIQPWSSIGLILAILYNEYCFQIRPNQVSPKAYAEIDRYMNRNHSSLHSLVGNLSNVNRLIQPNQPSPPKNEAKLTPIEEILVCTLYDCMVKAGFTSHPKLFFSLWDFCSKFCEDVHSRPVEMLSTKYKTIRDKRRKQLKAALAQAGPLAATVAVAEGGTNSNGQDFSSPTETIVLPLGGSPHERISVAQYPHLATTPSGLKRKEMS